jgi:hypothetical protein
MVLLIVRIQIQKTFEDQGLSPTSKAKIVAIPMIVAQENSMAILKLLF